MAEHTVHVIVVHVDGFTGVGEMPVYVFQKEACGFLFERLIFVMFQYGFQFPAVFTGFFQRRRLRLQQGSKEEGFSLQLILMLWNSGHVEHVDERENGQN